jgi:hypothetical protein
VQHTLKFCSVANWGARWLLFKIIYQHRARKRTGHGGPIWRPPRSPDILDKSNNKPVPRNLFPLLQLAVRHLNLVSLTVPKSVSYIFGKNIIQCFHSMTMQCRSKPVVFPDKPSSVAALQTRSKRHNLKTMYIFCLLVIWGRRRRTR